MPKPTHGQPTRVGRAPGCDCPDPGRSSGDVESQIESLLADLVEVLPTEEGHERIHESGR